MKNTINYTDEPLGKLRVIEDFLPPLEDLIFKEDNIKVTLSLSKASVNFFKQQAKANHTSYQGMIRKLIDIYASQFNMPATPKKKQLQKK
jgi:hypothetical protein